MKFKINFPFDTSPRSISWFNTIALMVLFFVFIGLFYAIKSYVNPWLTGLMLFPPFVFLCYKVSSYSFEALVYPKVKLIYKTIHNLKGPSPDLEFYNSNYNSRDFLKKINQDVVSWSIQNKEEIKSLKERENFRREYVGNLAHELRTPLFLVQGYVQTLFEGAIEDEEKGKFFLEKAAKGVDRMVSLIEDLETVSKLESGKIKLDEQAFDIVKLVKTVFDALEERAEERKVKLTLNRDYGKSIMVVADKKRIEQVLTNLVINAINYSKPMGGKIELRLFDPQESIVVEVSDNGIGIEKDDLPRIFERFYRVEKSRNRKIAGSGLGLSICKHILEAHGKVINVRSVKDMGTTFTFSLDKANQK